MHLQPQPTSCLRVMHYHERCILERSSVMSELWPKQLVRWLGQWTKVKRCYGLVRDAERSTRRFDHIMRVRTDLFFFERIDVDALLRAGALAVPSGITRIAPRALNDHLAACARETCAAYFEVARDYTQCQGPFLQSARYSMGHDMGNTLLANRLAKHAVAVARVPVRYTLMRTCSGTTAGGRGLDCSR